MLIRIKTLKSNCKATLKVLNKKKVFDDDKKFYLHDKFLV